MTSHLQKVGKFEHNVDITTFSDKNNIAKYRMWRDFTLIYKIILGIPEFWLTIFKNVDMLQEMVQEHDEPVLAALTDVKVTFSDGSNQSSPMVSYES